MVTLFLQKRFHDSRHCFTLISCQFEFTLIISIDLIEHIAKVIPSTSFTEYGHVAKLINCIDPVLFRNLQSETMKILLLNQIYALFMEATNEEISKEFLYEKISHIANYDPALYQ